MKTFAHRSLFPISALALTRAMALGPIFAEVTTAQFKELTDKFAEAKTAFDKKSEELTVKAEAALKEAKDKGTLVETTKAEVDKLLVEQTTLKGALNEAHAKIMAIEQEVARRPTGTLPSEKTATVGAQLVGSEKFKAWRGDPKSDVPRGRFRYSVNAAITSVDFPATSPSIVEPQRLPGILPVLKQRLFVRDLINVGQTGSPAIFWVQQTGFTNNADVVSENTLKPTSTIAYESKITPVTTIAHLFKASKQIMDDFAQLRTDVDRELRYGLKYVEEQEILFGDGTGMHLEGIIPQATPYHKAFSAVNHNRIDDIRLAMLQAQLARMPATGIVMHFTDWARIELTKDANGQYIFANPLRVAGDVLWGLPVVPTEINAFLGNFLTGAFQGAAQIYDREEINVEIATENNDDFEKNMITMRCEERLALAVFRPEAFIYGDFTVQT